jgi:hypothetical protein
MHLVSVRTKGSSLLHQDLRLGVDLVGPQKTPDLLFARRSLDSPVSSSMPVPVLQAPHDPPESAVLPLALGIIPVLNYQSDDPRKRVLDRTPTVLSAPKCGGDLNEGQANDFAKAWV